MPEDPFARPRVVVVQRLSGFRAVLGRDAEGRVALTPVPDGQLPSLEEGEKLNILSSDGEAKHAIEAWVSDEGPGILLLDDGQDEDAPRFVQQRRFARVAVPEMRIHVVPGEGGSPEPADMLNISAGGARASTSVQGMVPGSRLKLVFELPTSSGQTKQFDLVGEVAWAGRTGGGKSLLGIRFLETDEATEAQIAGWVLRQQAKGLA